MDIINIYAKYPLEISLLSVSNIRNSKLSSYTQWLPVIKSLIHIQLVKLFVVVVIFKTNHKAIMWQHLLGSTSSV